MRIAIDRMYFELFINGKMKSKLYANLHDKIYTENIKHVKACGGLSTPIGNGMLSIKKDSESCWYFWRIV